MRTIPRNVLSELAPGRVSVAVIRTRGGAVKGGVYEQLPSCKPSLSVGLRFGKIFVGQIDRAWRRLLLIPRSLLLRRLPTNGTSPKTHSPRSPRPSQPALYRFRSVICSQTSSYFYKTRSTRNASMSRLPPTPNRREESQFCHSAEMRRPRRIL